MTEGAKLFTIKFLDINRYQIEKESSNIKMDLEKVVDINVSLNFIAMVYNEGYNIEMNKLLIYDIDQMAFTKQVSINPNTANLRYLYVDDQGHCCF